MRKRERRWMRSQREKTLGIGRGFDLEREKNCVGKSRTEKQEPKFQAFKYSTSHRQHNQNIKIRRLSFFI